jgi:hypothetical protein
MNSDIHSQGKFSSQKPSADPSPYTPIMGKLPLLTPIPGKPFFKFRNQTPRWNQFLPSTHLDSNILQKEQIMFPQNNVAVLGAFCGLGGRRDAVPGTE